MKIYHNPRCSKSRQALKLLEDAGVSLTIIRYMDTSLTVDELTDIISMLDISSYELVRKGEAIYKENYRGQELTDEEWVAAMVKYPKLIERPIVISDDGRAIVGRPPEVVLDLL